ncbi:MAG TPA: hypothetical protein VGK10_12055 [Prolixibacteraceae bacterium]
MKQISLINARHDFRLSFFWIIFIFNTMIGMKGLGQTTILSGTIVNASTITAGSTIIINAGGTLNMDETKTFLSITIANDGTSTISGTYNLIVSNNIFFIDPGSKKTINLIISNTGITSCQAFAYTLSNLSTRSYNTSLESGTLSVSNTIPFPTSTINETITYSFSKSYTTINYNGSAQTVLGTTYNNLTTSGSGTKTLGGATIVNGTLTNIGVKLATNTYSLTFGGDFINGGIFTAVSSPITISGSATTQNIDGFITTGLVSMTKSSGTAILQGNVSGAGLTISGSGTLLLGSGLTHTFTGSLLISSGILNGGSSTLRLGSAFTFNDGTFIADKGTVEYYANGNQSTCAVLIYNNLTLSSSGIKKFATSPTINGILSMEGTASIDIVNGEILKYGANATLQYNTTITKSSSSIEWITPFTASGGVIIANTGRIILNAPKIFIASVPLTIKSAATLDASTFSNTFGSNSTITINGTFQTSNSLGFSGASGTALSSTNSAIISLGGSSTIEYNAIGIQNVSSGTFNNLTTSGTGTKTIPAGSAVTVNGTLTTNNLLSISSDATNSGSLIVNGTSTGAVNYNRWLNHSGDTFGRWYITSAPVNAPDFGTINVTKIHSTDGSYDFATYTEANNAGWEYKTDIPAINAAITPGGGYLISLNATSNGLVQFTGLLNNGPVSPAVAHTGANNGWNAVGNPYPSAIQITGPGGFIDTNTTPTNDVLSDSYAAIYVWNETGSYAIGGTEQYFKAIGNSGYFPPVSGSTLLEDVHNIQAGQGFLINSKVSGHVTFNKAMQVHQTDLSLKSAQLSWPGLTLHAESQGQRRSTVLSFHEGMSTGLDVTYDAGLLASDYFQLYTHLVEGDNPVDFTIQCLPDHHYSQLSVPVGVDLPEGGELAFKVTGMILPDGIYPVIEDRLLNIRTPLKTETDGYTVTLDKNTRGIGRFFLSFDDITFTKPRKQLEYKYTASLMNGTIVVNGLVEPGTKALLFDICGRKIGEYPLLNENRNEIMALDLTQRVYLLRIEGRNYCQVLKLLAIKY